MTTLSDFTDTEGEDNDRPNLPYWLVKINGRYYFKKVNITITRVYLMVEYGNLDINNISNDTKIPPEIIQEAIELVDEGIDDEEKFLDAMTRDDDDEEDESMAYQSNMDHFDGNQGDQE